MKKIIPFSKDIKFNTKIYEISSISLENTLVVEEDNDIDGDFIVSGDYKVNDTSLSTEPFIYSIPFDISLDNIYENDSIKVDIDDFKYEIINEEILKINIDVSVEGEEKEIPEEEEIKPDVIISAREEKEEERNDDVKDDLIEVEDLFKEEPSEVKEVTSIFNSFNSNDDKYVSYHVHIVRENDNIDAICNSYNVSIEDIKEYNDIDQITLGNKIIIPYKNNETI